MPGAISDSGLYQLLFIESQDTGVWRSLVARFVRDEEAVGSNPATPTIVMSRDIVPAMSRDIVVFGAGLPADSAYSPRIRVNGQECVSHPKHPDILALCGVSATPCYALSFPDLMETVSISL